MSSRTKKGSIRWWHKQLDAAFSKLVVSKGFCEYCLKTDNLQCAHIIPRTNHSLRWDIFNAVCLCYTHHIHWAHQDPIGFTDWLTAIYPQRMVYLQENRNNIVKRTLQDYQRLLEAIENKDFHGLVTFTPRLN